MENQLKMYLLKFILLIQSSFKFVRRGLRLWCVHWNPRDDQRRLLASKIFCSCYKLVEVVVCVSFFLFFSFHFLSSSSNVVGESFERLMIFIWFSSEILNETCLKILNFKSVSRGGSIFLSIHLCLHKTSSFLWNLNDFHGFNCFMAWVGGYHLKFVGIK